MGSLDVGGCVGEVVGRGLETVVEGVFEAGGAGGGG